MSPVAVRSIVECGSLKISTRSRPQLATEVGVSDWAEVTQQRIDQFAQATGDEQWIHVNVERATRELPGHSTIAHGLLTLALAPEIVRSVMGVKGIKNTLNYGANRIRYLQMLCRRTALSPFRTFQAGLRPARANPGRVPSYFHRALVAPRFRSR